MTIQFVDLRLSNQAASDATPAVIPLAATPLVFGDIGIQTAGVSADNQGNVRILLTGFLKVENNPLSTLIPLMFAETEPSFSPQHLVLRSAEKTRLSALQQ